VQVPGEAFLTAATAAAPGSVCASLLQEAEDQDLPLTEWQVIALWSPSHLGSRVAELGTTCFNRGIDRVGEPPY